MQTDRGESKPNVVAKGRDHTGGGSEDLAVDEEGFGRTVRRLLQTLPQPKRAWPKRRRGRA